jgi:hypothetical protein
MAIKASQKKKLNRILLMRQPRQGLAGCLGKKRGGAAALVFCPCFHTGVCHFDRAQRGRSLWLFLKIKNAGRSLQG